MCKARRSASLIPQHWPSARDDLLQAISCGLDHRSVGPLIPDYTLCRLVIGDECGRTFGQGDVVMGGFSPAKVTAAQRVLRPSES